MLWRRFAQNEKRWNEKRKTKYQKNAFYILQAPENDNKTIILTTVLFAICGLWLDD